MVELLPLRESSCGSPPGFGSNTRKLDGARAYLVTNPSEKELLIVSLEIEGTGLH